MTRIWERLFIRSLQDAARLARKNPSGIDTVITLCEQSVEDKAAGVRYIHLPIEDNEAVPSDQFEAVMDAIALNIQDGNVLVHCALGLSRSPTLMSYDDHKRIRELYGTLATVMSVKYSLGSGRKKMNELLLSTRLEFPTDTNPGVCTDVQLRSP